MTHLYIEQATDKIEEVNSSIISKLYELAISGDLDETSDLKGRLHSTGAKAIHVAYLNANYSDLHISADKLYLTFEDAEVDRILTQKYGDGVGVPLSSLVGISTIPDNLFKYNTTIVSFDELATAFPNATSLATYAFDGCTHLESIDLKNIQYLYAAAFSNSGLTGIINLPSIKQIGVNGGMCFANCSNITEINCGNSFEQFIGSENFYGCTALTKVTGLSNLTSIPNSTFYNCTNLSSVDIDWSKITSIGDDAFCINSLPGIISLPNIAHLGSRCFYSATGITSVTIGGNDVLTLPNHAFYECTNLTTAVLPNVTSLGLGVFSGCSNLTTVDLSNVVTVGNEAFSGCTSLTSLSLPKCTTINDLMAFTHSGIVSISLPLCTSIGRSSFHWATYLTSVSIPSCTYIGPVAFDHCLSLTSITLPEGLLTIGDYAFTASAFTGYFEIPSTVTSIGKELFRDSPNITGYVFKGTTPPTLSNGLGKMFYTHLNGNLVRPIYVPDASVSAYLATFADNPDYVAAIKPMSQKPS